MADVRLWVDLSFRIYALPVVVPDPIQLHKSKHLLSHVLTAAVRRRWPLVGTGNSGETREGFFVDLLVGDEVDVETHFMELEGEMRRVLTDVEHFSALELAPHAARDLFVGNPIKQSWLEAVAERGETAWLYDLDGVVDVCDCALKHPRELRAIDPGVFELAGAIRLPWQQHARILWVTRITGAVAGSTACLCPLCVAT